MRESYGEPDIITVRKVFDNAQRCAEWESTVLRRTKAAASHKFINKTNGDTKFDNTGMVPVTVISTGTTISVTTDEFHTNRHLYRHHSDGAVHVVCIATGSQMIITTDEFHTNRHLYRHRSTGVKLTAETRAKMSASHTGVPKTDQHKQNIAAALRGRKQSPEHLANATRNRNPAKKTVVINGVSYESISLAASTLGVSVGMLCNRLAGRLLSNAQWWEVRYG